MDINFSLLKFHHFNKNKEFNNLTKSNSSVYEKETFDDLYKSLKVLFNQTLKDKKTFNELLDIPKCHLCTNKNELIIHDIIRKCHPNLFADLNQFLEKYDKLKDIKIIQFKIDAKTRVICFYNEDNQTIYPLIFDFKHCIYKLNDDKKYHFKNDTKSLAYGWDHKHEQNKIKIFLNNNQS